MYVIREADVRSYPGKKPDGSPNGEINPNDPNSDNFYNLSWRKIRSKSVKVMICPSDRGHEVLFSPEIENGNPNPDGEPVQGKREYNHPGKNWARGNYAANAGPHRWYKSVGGQSHMMDENWFNYLKPRAGGVMCINYGAKLNQLTGEDGTSNTIMFNEVRVGVSKLDRRGVWAFGFPGSSVTAGHGLFDCKTPNDHEEFSDDIQECYKFWYSGIGTFDGMGCWDWRPPSTPSPITRGSVNEQAQARSRHPQGVNVCMGDGSVRFVQQTIRDQIWVYMNSRNDGEPYNFSSAFED